MVSHDFDSYNAVHQCCSTKNTILLESISDVKHVLLMFIKYQYILCLFTLFLLHPVKELKGQSDTCISHLH